MLRLEQASAGANSCRHIKNSFKYSRIRMKTAPSALPTDAGLTPASRPGDRKLPFRADEMTGVSVRIAFEVILMFGLRFPEVPRGASSVTAFPGQSPDCVDILDWCPRRCAFCSVADIEDGGAIAQAPIVCPAGSRLEREFSM